MNKIGKTINLIKKEVKKFKEPVVTKLSKKRSPFQVLISCIISLRTKDSVTFDASKRLFNKAKTPEETIRLSETQIQKLIYPAGFYKRKSKTIRDISRVLISKYGSKVPRDFDELMKLKGVGRKTANIVMVFGHYKKDYIPVDIHCHRIPNRLGWIKTKTPDETEFALKRIVPKRYWQDFNDTFVIFGQNICVPVSPFCSKCPVKKYCQRVGVKRSR